MNANITGENDERVGLYVDDNNDVEHWLEMEFDGEIKYHEQDGYPDKAAKRTPEGDEHVSQARRYARYHVQQETEYNTVPWEEDISQLERVITAVESLSTEAFETYFGTYFDQLNSELPTIKKPVDLPSEIDEDEFYLCLLDVYLDETGAIEATSGIHFLYLDHENEQNRHVWGTDPFPEREPDARLQLIPQYLPSIEVGQTFFAYHLRCLIRDCYLLMGVEPPEKYRILGPGLYEATSRYMDEDRPYAAYHKLHADMPGYELEFDYGLGEQGKQIAQTAGEIRDVADGS